MPSDDFSEGELHALTALNVTLAVFSFMGSAFIVLMFLRVKSLRSSFVFR